MTETVSKFPLQEYIEFMVRYLSNISDVHLIIMIKELGINNNTSGNTTYKPTSFDKDEILANHRSFMTSLNIPSGKESEDLPY